MATYVEIPGGDASTDKDGIRTYQRTFRVYGLDPNLRPSFGILTVPINRFDPHPDDSGALAVGVSSAFVNGELGVQDVTYSYTSRPFDAGIGEDVETGGPGGGELSPGATDPTANNNPLNRPPTIKFSQNTVQVPFVKDYNPAGAKPVRNSAGVPFEGETVDEITSIITISFNKGVLDVSDRQQTYCGCCNDASFSICNAFPTSFPAYTLRCNAWTGTIQFEEGIWYTACEIELEYNRHTWTRRLLDVGYTYLDGTVDILGRPILKRFLDQSTGAPVDHPMYLNGAGAPNPPLSAPVPLTFYPHPQVSFASIF